VFVACINLQPGLVFADKARLIFSVGSQGVCCWPSLAALLNKLERFY